MVMRTKYSITTLSFPADITESRIKKNENSLTAERWLFSQIKASRPFVGQYICHCILSPIVWIRKSAMYVLYVRLDVHIGVCSIVSPVYNARQRPLTIGHRACSSSQDCFSVLRHAWDTPNHNTRKNDVSLSFIISHYFYLFAFPLMGY